ncbi:MAG: hypothetical protein R3B60_00435 [Candidatus Paceibacterota bacterium]
MFKIVILFFFIFIIIASFYIGNRNLRRSYIKAGVIHSRFIFALSVLGISQILLLFPVAVFEIATNSTYIAGGMLISWDVITIILIFVFSLLLYGRFKKNLLGSVESLPRTNKKNFFAYFVTYVYSVIALLCVWILFTVLPGKEYVFGTLATIAVNSGSPELLEVIPLQFDWEKEHMFTDMAVLHKDPSICDKKKNIDKINGCKKASIDAMVVEYYKDRIGSTKSKDKIDCTQVKNIYESKLVGYSLNHDECSYVSVIQEALANNNPLICDRILERLTSENETNIAEYEFIIKKHAACTVHFHGSSVWKTGCERFSDQSKYDVLASCRYDKVIEPFNGHLSDLPEYWYWFK